VDEFLLGHVRAVLVDDIAALIETPVRDNGAPAQVRESRATFIQNPKPGE